MRRKQAIGTTATRAMIAVGAMVACALPALAQVAPWTAWAARVTAIKPDTSTLSQSETAAAVAAVATAVRTELAKLSPNASAEDAEAAVVFALSQVNQPPAIIQAALQQVAGDKHSVAVAQALANARRAAQGSRTGTAGIVGGNRSGGPAGGGDALSSLGFAGVIGGGGGGGAGGNGSSNYSTVN